MLEFDVFDLLIYNTIFQKSILEKLFTNANMKMVLYSVAFGILETYLHPFPGHEYAHLHLETGTDRGKDKINGGPLVPLVVLGSWHSIFLQILMGD